MAYTVRLDQNKAKELARTGASLLLLNVPEGARIGIDHQVGLDAISSKTAMWRSFADYPG